MSEKQSLLIIDDETFNLKILGGFLNSQYNIILAKDGKEGLERALNQKPDLILLDILMPEQDGYQVIKELKNNDDTKSIPVIFISALAETEDEEKGLLLGAVDYIIKPFTPAVVKARISTHMKIVRQRKLLENIALLDGLTEIPNRRSFSEKFEKEARISIRNQKAFSVIFIDVDFFKEYNDNYGHTKGDEALKNIASVISETLKRPGDYVARYGGEEFVVILPDTPSEGGLKIANEIRKSVESLGIEHKYSKTGEVLTISAGGSTLVPYDVNDKLILENADEMLYYSKKSGRNMASWKRSMD